MDICRYVTEYGEYDDSTGLIAVSYNGDQTIAFSYNARWQNNPMQKYLWQLKNVTRFTGLTDFYKLLGLIIVKTIHNHSNS